MKIPIKDCDGRGSVEKSKLFFFCNTYLFLSLALIFLFAAVSLLFPRSQNELVYRGGADFQADFVNHVKYTFAQNIYTAENAPVIGELDFTCLSSAGARRDRLFPPLAYLMLYIPRSMTAMNVSSAPMFWVTALWSVTCWSAMLMLICFVQIHGETWRKLLFCFTFFFSGVMLYAMERGTLVLLSSSLTAFFIFNYQSCDRRLRELSLIALALAAGLKISPAILGVLLLIEGRKKDSLKLLLYGVTAFFLPFAFLPGGFRNVQYQFENIIANGGAYLCSGHHIGVGLNGELLYVLGEYLFGKDWSSAYSINLFFYSVLAEIAILGVILAFFERERWKKIFLVILPILFIPQDSGYYNLLYLLPVIILLCNEREEISCPRTVAVVVLAFLLMPLRFMPCQVEHFGAIFMDLLAIMVVANSLSACIARKRRIAGSSVETR